MGRILNWFDQKVVDKVNKRLIQLKQYELSDAEECYAITVAKQVFASALERIAPAAATLFIACIAAYTAIQTLNLGVLKVTGGSPWHETSSLTYTTIIVLLITLAIILISAYFNTMWSAMHAVLKQRSTTGNSSRDNEVRGGK